MLKFSQFALLAASAILLLIVRYGYHESINDHDIIDLKGLHQVHPDYYKNDWFVEKVPQPHIVNDHFVEWSERAGILAEAKMIYWAVSVSIFAFACFLFGIWSGGFSYAFGLMALLILGPTSPLGSGTALLGWQLPHSLGGALLLLGFMGLILDRRSLVISCLFLTPLAHVQHGLHLSLIAFAWCFFSEFQIKKQRVLCALSLTSGVLSLWMAHLGNVTGADSSFSDACKVYTPFHCLSSSWPDFWWLTGVFILLAQIPLLRFLYRESKPASVSMGLTLLSINICYWLCMGIEYFQVEPLAGLVRGTNFFRWITLLLFSACAGLLLLLRPTNFKWPRMVGFLVLFLGFYLRTFTSVADGMPLQKYSILAAVTIFIAVIATLIKNATPRMWMLNLGFVVCILYFSTPLPPRERFLEVGRQVENLVPPGEIIIASPMVEILRAISHRAVIADRKGVPYGEPYLTLWKQRIVDLGGGDDESYAKMPYEHWLSIAKKYNARYAFLIATDTRGAELEKYHQLVYINKELMIRVFKLNY